MLSPREILKKIKRIFLALRNMNRLGTVKEVIGDKLVVDYGDNIESPQIRWFALAGEFSTWRAPSVGEQCLTINYSGGDDETSCVALVGLYSSAHPTKSINPKTAHMRWSDFFDATVKDNGSLLVKLKKSIRIEAGESIEIEAGQTVDIDAGSIMTLTSGDDMALESGHIGLND